LRQAWGTSQPSLQRSSSPSPRPSPIGWGEGKKRLLNIFADEHEVGGLPLNTAGLGVGPHAAHDILDAAKTARLQETRGNRTAITTAANHGQRLVFQQFGDSSRHAGERHVHRAVKMFGVPFAESSHVEDLGSIAVPERGFEIANTQLRKLLEFVERIGLGIANDVVVANAGEFESGFLRAVRGANHQRDGFAEGNQKANLGGKEAAAQPDVQAVREMAGAEERGAAGIEDQRAAQGFTGEFGFREFAQRRQ